MQPYHVTTHTATTSDTHRRRRLVQAGLTIFATFPYTANPVLETLDCGVQNRVKTNFNFF